MSYSVDLSARAAKDLDRLNRDILNRILARLEKLSADPFDPRFSAKLTHKRGLRKSRVGGWRIIFIADNEAQRLSVLTVERRGEVYRRI